MNSDDSTCRADQTLSVTGLELLDVTLPSGEENLALDEALLLEADEAEEDEQREVLRLWEPASPLVVIGRATKVEEEVHLDVCRDQGIPVLRRTSGGAAIVAGPGCLMYSVVLNLRRRGELRAIDKAHRLVLNTLSAALEPLCPGIRCRGTSDLSVDGHKVSGNSLQVKRNALLYHGTLLYNFPLGTIEDLLKMPPRQPGYRGLRSHLDFVMNIPAAAGDIRAALVAGWGASRSAAGWPQHRVAELVAQKYRQSDWNLRR